MRDPLTEQEKEQLIAVLRASVKGRGGRAHAAELWGISERTLAGYLSGESDPKLSFLSKVAASEGLSVAELFTSSAEKSTSPSERVLMIPMRDVFASAGPGAENGDEPIVGYMQFPEVFVRSWGRSPARVEAIQARGDSMFPTVLDGQWVLIDRADRTLTDGLVYGFRTPDGLRLKRFQKAIDGTPMLVSDNRELYAPERLQPDDFNQLRVAGRAFLTPRMI